MKPSWPVKPIGDLCNIIGGGTPSKSNAAFFKGSIPWATVRDMKADWIEATEHSITPDAVKSSATNVLPSGAVVIASRVGLGKICRVRNDTAINQDLRGFIPKPKSQLDIQYLFWWFKSVAWQIIAAGNGATVQGVTLPFLRSLEIPLPPLDEQRRIVAVLDKAFAGIATATANAQKNLPNARALFESYLAAHLQIGSTDGPCTDIGSEVEFCFGFAFKSNGYTDKADGIRLLRGDNIVNGALRWDGVVRWPKVDFDAYRSFEMKSGDVVLAMDRTWVKSGLKFAVIQDADLPLLQVQRVARMRCRPSILNRYLSYQIESPAFTSYIVGIQTGLGVPHISGKQIAAFKFSKRPLQEQAELVERLDRLKAKASSMEAAYQSKLAALTELKQSLLREAFSGELITTEQTFASATNDNFSSPQFTAQVIAFAHRRHEQEASQKTFGHVKAQKTLHLVESIGGIDLGRRPIKDAAGPNDMRHMLRATNWAVQQGFFEFAPRANGNGYDFRKLANYDALWAEAVVATRPVVAALERAIDPIVPMVSLEAELFATVHAAWNNLICDRTATTDDAIVKEARENWHSKKLNIPEQKFRSTIKLIRAKGLEPDGNAKYVGGQAKLI